jgi:hypothetical protein
MTTLLFTGVAPLDRVAPVMGGTALFRSAGITPRLVVLSADSGGISVPDVCRGTLLVSAGFGVGSRLTSDSSANLASVCSCEVRVCS